MSKKIGIIIASVAAIAVCASIAFASTSYFSIVRSATSTSTVQALYPGGASYTMDLGLVNDVDQINLNLMLNASTTDSVLTWKYQFSNNNIDWYDQDSPKNVFGADLGSALEIMTHSAEPAIHSWAPANSTASTTLKNVKIDDINAGYMRIVFTGTTATSTLYAEANLKRLPQ